MHGVPAAAQLHRSCAREGGTRDSRYLVSDGNSELLRGSSTDRLDDGAVDRDDGGHQGDPGEPGSRPAGVERGDAA
eukprot:5199004-Lingulodinium_polyedra.AAC.1